ncbi:Uncharacterised protein [Vibrio cholerae]|nr:Uncharacterised protein [Vibrio cholerae]
MTFAHRNQCFTNHRPVGRIMVAQQGFMQATLSFTFRHWHLFRFLVFHAFQRVHFCVIHRSSITHWRWVEVLYLVTTVVVGF